jgi:hypothetical protein
MFRRLVCEFGVYFILVVVKLSSFVYFLQRHGHFFRRQFALSSLLETEATVVGEIGRVISN